MTSNPSLSNYFGDGEPPPAAQFFDEISTAPTDMIQSVNLGDSEAKPTTAELFSESTQVQASPFEGIIPTVSGAGSLPASSLPDPSTFFDNIGSELEISPVKAPSGPSVDFLSHAVQGLTVTDPLQAEEERRRDAWIPSEETRKILAKAQAAPPGSFFLDREMLTTPAIVLQEELPDSIQEAVSRYVGVGEACGRAALRAEHVTRDEAGLRELLRTGYLRAATNLAGALLTAAGQGAGRASRPARHTARSLQLWLTRLALLTRIKRYDALQQEAAPFAHLDKPDLYYQAYPETFGSRSGCMAPFSLRLLLAEAPVYWGQPEQSLNALYAMLCVIQQMLRNLESGLTEDGGAGTLSEQDRSESVRLWSARAVRVQHSIVNSAVAMKEYRVALDTVSALAAAPELSVPQQRAYCSALCRLALHCGHVRAAHLHLQRAVLHRQHTCPTPDVRELVDLGLLDVAHSRYQEAYNKFARAADQDPTNVTVANNSAVCLLYMGRLREAVGVLERALTAAPERAYSELVLTNLSTLYELGCAGATARANKLALLRALARTSHDHLPRVAQALKLQT